METFSGKKYSFRTRLFTIVANIFVDSEIWCESKIGFLFPIALNVNFCLGSIIFSLRKLLLISCLPLNINNCILAKVKLIICSVCGYILPAGYVGIKTRERTKGCWIVACLCTCLCPAPASASASACATLSLPNPCQSC